MVTPTRINDALSVHCLYFFLFLAFGEVTETSLLGHIELRTIVENEKSLHQSS
jgi:hypothetical protein